MTPLSEMVRHEGDIRTDEVGRGPSVEKTGKISDEVGFRLRIQRQKQKLFYLKPKLTPKRYLSYDEVDN